MQELDPRLYIDEDCLVLARSAWSGEEPKPYIDDIMKQIDDALNSNNASEFNKLAVKYGIIKADWL